MSRSVLKSLPRLACALAMAAGAAWTTAAAASEAGPVWLGNPTLAAARFDLVSQVPRPKPAPARKVSLDDKIGQMIMVGFVGTLPDDPGVRAVRRELEDGTVGGVLVLSRNVTSPSQIKALNASLQRRGDSRPITLIGVDQEGGAIQRLKARSGHTSFPSASRVASDKRYSTGDKVVALYSRMAAGLASEGFNVNFGPVVDLNINPSNPIIGRLGRSYGTDPETVGLYARWFALAHQGAGVLTAAKHFPGHGSSTTDSHVGFTDISATWRQAEMKPFKDLAGDQFVDMVMVGHLYHPRFSDGPGIPASLSARAIRSLRRDVGFEGVIVADDLEMGALRNHFSFEDRIVRAILAGEDLIVFANRIDPRPDLGARIHAVIARAVRDGTIPPARIDDAYHRIMQMKARVAERRMAEQR